MPAAPERSTNEVHVQTSKGVMTVTLADVENRNALGARLVRGVYDAIRAANDDPAVRVVVLTNEGSTFCAGANLKERQKQSDDAADGIDFVALLREVQSSATPIVARIAGHVVGGGNGLAAAVDIAIADEAVKFGFTEVRLGVAPAIISVVCLPKMRRGEAMEVFLRGNRFAASKAADLGLISRAVPRADLDDAIAEVVADLRKGGPKALGFAKQLVYEVPKKEQQDAFAWTARLSGELFAGEEAAEGMAAFLGKRKPSWAEPNDD